MGLTYFFTFVGVVALIGFLCTLYKDYSHKKVIQN